LPSEHCAPLQPPKYILKTPLKGVVCKRLEPFDMLLCFRGDPQHALGGDF
jgi:hypothetical protein